MKKQGSILIEVAASIVILTLATTFIVSVSMKNMQVLKERILLEEVNRDVWNVINEFKYNLTKEEIKEMLSDGKIGFKYSEDFSKKLLNMSPKELENGNEIEITKIGEDDIGIRFKVQTNIKNEKNEALIEQEFTKSWWMDEV